MRWLLWCFCLLAESYETINHYHYHYHYHKTFSDSGLQSKKWFTWLWKQVKKKIPQFSVTIVIWSNTEKLKFYSTAWSWNKMRTRTLSSTGADIVNSLYLNVAYLYFVIYLWTVLRTRVTPSIAEIIYITKPPRFDNNIHDLNRQKTKRFKMIRIDAWLRFRAWRDHAANAWSLCPLVSPWS